MKIYAPSTFQRWESVRDITTGKPQTVSVTGKSVGFMPYFLVYDDCKAEYPDYDVIEFEMVEKEDK